MKSLENLKEKIHDILINNDGDIKLSEHKDIINDAKEVGLDERQLSKLVIEVDRSINWDFIRKQKEEAVKREEELKKAIEEQKQKDLNADETLQFIIEQCAKDQLFGTSEIIVYFETSYELQQEENKSAKILKSYFDKNNYIPLTTPKGTSLKLLLESTDWYKDKLPPPLPQPFQWKMVVTAVALILIVGGALTYFLYLKPKWLDDATPRYFTAAQDAILRSSKIAKVDYNKVGTLPFGVELITYSHDIEWSEVKTKIAGKNKKGFVASKLIVDKKDFILLNSIFGDNESRTTIETIKCRLALLNYFKDKNYIGKIDESIQKEVFGNIQSAKEIWQVYSKAKNAPTNTVFYPPKRIGAKFTDFAVIIKNEVTGQRKLLFFRFDDDETPHLEYEEPAPDNGDIKKILKINGHFQVVYSNGNSSSYIDENENNSNNSYIKDEKNTTTDLKSSFDQNIIIHYYNKLFNKNWNELENMYAPQLERFHSLSNCNRSVAIEDHIKYYNKWSIVSYNIDRNTLKSFIKNNRNNCQIELSIVVRKKHEVKSIGFKILSNIIVDDRNMIVSVSEEILKRWYI
jgi:hypothetical protein